MSGAILIHPSDNVEVILSDGGPIPRGHKCAARDIMPGEHIIKYGHPIGYATEFIPKGAHVHEHNVKTNLSGELEYEYSPAPIPVIAPVQATFMGYPRQNGDVGIRNDIWIVPTVGCVNQIALTLASRVNAKLGCERAFAFPHPYGCSQMGGDQLRTQLTLKGLVNHPNAGGVLVLGLGCENNNIAAFKSVLGEWDDKRVLFLNAQDSSDELANGEALIWRLLDYADKCERQPVPASQLVIGLKCGGSDGLSGITANPLVGRISDMLTACGGTTILSEVPEMFGAETLLMNRAKDIGVFNDIVRLINDFKEYYKSHNQVIYENPSPGNKAGGLTTLEDKSLGCTQKGGNSAVNAVIHAGERAMVPGLILLSGPGNDMVAVTELTAAGAHMILFTTGRGTPLGAPVPTVKISSNTQLAGAKPAWIDFDAGALADGASMDDISAALFDKLLRIASGLENTKNELNGYREIAIFKDGVTL